MSGSTRSKTEYKRSQPQWPERSYAQTPFPSIIIPKQVKRAKASEATSKVRGPCPASPSPFHIQNTTFVNTNHRALILQTSTAVLLPSGQYQILSHKILRPLRTCTSLPCYFRQASCRRPNFLQIIQRPIKLRYLSSIPSRYPAELLSLPRSLDSFGCYETTSPAVSCYIPHNR